MNYFFTPENELPMGVGFAQFGRDHIAWLCIALALNVLLCAIYCRMQSGGRTRLCRGVAGAILLCEIAKDANLIIQGLFNIYYLPLHLCSLAVFFTVAHAVRPNKVIGNFLYSTCMAGALFALLCPDWGMFPAFSYHSLVAFVVHSLLVAYPLMQVVGRELRPEGRYLKHCLAILLCLAIPIYIFDRIFYTNYMFLIVPPAGTPLEWFDSFLGNPGYLLGFLPMIAVIWTILYLPFAKKNENAIIAENKKKGKKFNAEE